MCVLQNIYSEYKVFPLKNQELKVFKLEVIFLRDIYKIQNICFNNICYTKT